MDTLRILIDRDNAAFDDGDGGNSEVARILRALADTLDTQDGSTAALFDGIALRDVNGNVVGRAQEVTP